MRELKPCPFCGTAAERVDIDGTDEFEPNVGGSYICCPNCYASSKVVFGEKSGLEEAWNTRIDAALSAPDESALEKVRKIRSGSPFSSDGNPYLTDTEAAALIQPSVPREMLEEYADLYFRSYDLRTDKDGCQKVIMDKIAAKHGVKVR